ncbi:hypothetical protein L2E82_11624 [Cichorium intybus]|uniref:Uncharacterized protein n=1 Tax=Cichorium intybus TaxID=13427 RepID=A0ACB9GEU6_CICIN|nr:hypothetical protein L2E82_11624 [Cichorium intybus]
MDFFLHYRNPNIHSSSSLVGTSNKVNNRIHGTEGEKKKNKRNNKISTKVKLSTDPQSIAARERRHRISERFKILRSLIPGGDTRNMDTVSMLEEAIQYVKFLKAQIWLHQTMISFENFDDYANGNYHHYDEYSHQNLLPSDHYYSDYHHFSSLPQMEHEILPQVGFQEGSCFKVEDDDNMFSLSHGDVPERQLGPPNNQKRPHLPNRQTNTEHVYFILIDRVTHRAHVDEICTPLQSKLALVGTWKSSESQMPHEDINLS